jgi:hypothetical protein
LSNSAVVAGDQVVALGRTRACQIGVAAGDQPLAGEVLVREGNQVSLVEQVELQGTAVGQLADRPALQRRDPIDAVQVAHGVDLHAGDHAAVARHDEPVDAE